MRMESQWPIQIVQAVLWGFKDSRIPYPDLRGFYSKIHPAMCHRWVCSPGAPLSTPDLQAVIHWTGRKGFVNQTPIPAAEIETSS
jgi:hypothetical protein